jgi:hypothetical protein
MKTIKLPTPVQLRSYSNGGKPLQRRALKDGIDIIEDVPPTDMFTFLEDIVFTDPALNIDEKSGKARTEIRQIMRAVSRLRDTAMTACERKLATMDVEDYDYDLVLGVVKNPKAGIAVGQLSQLEPLFAAWENPIEKTEEKK